MHISEAECLIGTGGSVSAGRLIEFTEEKDKEVPNTQQLNTYTSVIDTIIYILLLSPADPIEWKSILRMLRK